MTDAAWLKAQDAWEHVLEHELVPDIAQKKLIGILRKGGIPGRGKLSDQSTVAVLPTSFWSSPYVDLSVNFQANSAVSRVRSPSHSIGPDGRVSPVQYTSVTNVDCLEFSSRHIFAEWPALATTSVAAQQPAKQAPAKPHRPLNTGLDRANAPFIAQMRILIETTGITANAAALRIIKEHGVKVPGDGLPDSTKRRLVGRYKAEFNGE